MREKKAIPVVSGARCNKGLPYLTVHVLYVMFNTACTVVYGYQIYLWLRLGVWTKFPSRLLFYRGDRYHFASPFGMMDGIAEWVLNVELAYTLGVIAITFYAVRWWIDRQVKRGEGAAPIKEPMPRQPAEKSSVEPAE